MGLLSPDQIQKELAQLKGWQLVPTESGRVGKEIKKTFELNDFVHAMGFVQSVALLAEKANHHPDIDIRWNKVAITLSTHSAGGVTENDISLARAINAI